MKKKAKKGEEEVIEGEEIRKVWDLRKIVVGFVALVTLLILLSYLFVPKYAGETDSRTTLGANTDEEVPPLPNGEDVDRILNNAQAALSKISSENLTSSQAAIQKVITDLQKLQGGGVGGAFCSLICGGE